MLVAGEDQIGLRGERAGEYMVVVGIVGDDGKSKGSWSNICYPGSPLTIPSNSRPFE
jgi:hypothetical protein